MFSRGMAWRRLVAAVALAAVFFVAVPAQAADGREDGPGLFERLIEWIVGLEMAGGGTSGGHEGGHLDPNGGGHPGSCNSSEGCENPQGVSGAVGAQGY